MRPLTQIDGHFADKVVSMDSAHLTVPGTPLPSDPNIPDSVNIGFFLPPSGVGYRVNTFGLPVDTTNFATRGVVTALEQIGLKWNQRYQWYLHQGTPSDKIPPITRPYLIIGLLSKPGGGIIKNQSQEPLNYKPVTGNEADFLISNQIPIGRSPMRRSISFLSRSDHSYGQYGRNESQLRRTGHGGSDSSPACGAEGVKD